MILSLHNIVAGYGGSDVLKGVNLEIETGSITCIVGPNGAGKSTVLRVISGLLKPRIGEITYNGRSIAGMTPRQILSLGIVQVPQNHSLFPEISVRENVRMGAFILNDPALVAQTVERSGRAFPGGQGARQGKGRQLVGRAAAPGRVCPFPDARAVADPAG